MADGNQLKMGDQVDLADDDPFAELTRIMGFDPRQSVKEADDRAVAEKTAKDASANVASGRHVSTSQSAVSDSDPDEADDFSIDLEKELMGDFSVDDEEFAASLDAQYDDEPHIEAPAEQAEASTPSERQDDVADIDFDFDDAIAASVADEAERASDRDDESREEHASAPAHHVSGHAEDEAHQDMDIGAELDAAMALVDFDSGADDQPLAHQALQEDGLSEAFSSTEEPMQEEPEEVGIDRHMADALEARPDPGELQMDVGDLEADLDRISLEAAGPDVADVMLDPEDLDFGAEELDSVDDELSLEQDQPGTEESRLDPVDLDFGAAELAAEAAEPAPADDHAVSADAPGEVDDYDFHLDAADFDLDDGDLPTAEDDGIALDDAPPNYAPDDEAPRSDALPDSASPSDPEISFDDFHVDRLEDEAETDDGYLAAAPAQPAAPARVPSPMDIAAAEYRDRGAAPVDLASAFDLEAELNALLGNKAEQHRIADEAVVAAVSGGSPTTGGDDELAWELEDLVEAAAAAEPAVDDESEAESELYYPAEDYPGEESFEPAFANSFGSDSSPAAAVDDRYAAPASDAVREPAPASSFSSIFAKAPAFSERYQQKATAYATNPGENSAGLPSGRIGAPRDPMREDPLDIIAELTAKYSQPLPYEAVGRHAQYDDAPDVETVEVSDRAVALADDLDLPDVDFDDELPPVSAYDELDTDFAGLLNGMNDSDAVPADTSGRYATAANNECSGAQRGYGINGSAATGVGSASTIPGVHGPDPDPFGVESDDLSGSLAPLSAQYRDDDDFDYDPDLDEALAVPGMAAAQQEARAPRRGLLVAAIVGGVALVGALGAFALSLGGGGDSDSVAVVRADDGPTKVKPENPGGTSVPNQESKVYDTVSGDGQTYPQQEKLVTTAEEPLNVADDPAAPVKSEDRIEQILEDNQDKSDAEIMAVAPRKVRTMVVRPDGTLVPREDDTASADISTDSVASAEDAVTSVPAPQSTGALPDQTDEATMASIDQEPDVAGAAQVGSQPSDTPTMAPIAPQRPAEQPIDVVGEVKPDQVASAATSAAGGWSMQIASQPTEAAAQTSYKNLVSRYGSVLNGREANIVKADIAGKGTFWRVRVPTASRNEAISLCETYKAAGGNCFVSK